MTIITHPIGDYIYKGTLTASMVSSIPTSVSYTQSYVSSSTINLSFLSGSKISGSFSKNTYFFASLASQSYISGTMISHSFLSGAIYGTGSVPAIAYSFTGSSTNWSFSDYPHEINLDGIVTTNCTFGWRSKSNFSINATFFNTSSVTGSFNSSGSVSGSCYSSSLSSSITNSIYTKLYSHGAKFLTSLDLRDNPLLSVIDIQNCEILKVSF